MSWLWTAIAFIWLASTVLIVGLGLAAILSRSIRTWLTDHLVGPTGAHEEVPRRELRSG
jgi:hypothetical protein